ncbi:MAG: hypothetical protein GY847_37375 [Proteobacteria bacterium]|nr:hypothetical protein [Pseudomonadota bacterium]
MKKYHLLCYMIFASSLLSCQTAEDAFIGNRLLTLCGDAYWICNVPSGCVLDDDHYSKKVFPDTHRVVIATEEPELEIRVRLFLSKMESPGTELLVQLYEPDCTQDINLARAHLTDIDLFEEAGDDRMLIFDLMAMQEGEHLLEIYSDASAEFLLIVEPD